MISTLYLSRARLRASRGGALSSIAPLLIPKDENKRASHAHRILWLLFQDVPDADRDFLWRDSGKGRFFVLSRRQPTNPLGLFELETKPFEPELEPGDRLRFALRANPVIATKQALSPEERTKRWRGKRVDVVMHALHSIPRGERVAARDEVASQATTRWLERQAERSGFKLSRAPIVSGYTQIPVERKKGRPAGFSVLDLEGEIEITEPAVFMAKLSQGFGSAKAFGNGLMLIRRS